MTIEQLEGMANISLSTQVVTETLTWNTATEWDNAVSESGVVHVDPVTGHDTPGAGTITLGYPRFDRGGSALEGFYPGHEGSGSTMNDVSGNARDFSMSGATPAATTGVHGRNTWSYDGTDDNGTGGGFDMGSWTWTAWVYHDSVGLKETLWDINNYNQLNTENSGEMWNRTYGDNNGGSATTLGSGTWNHLAYGYNPQNTMYVWLNGSLLESVSTTDGGTNNNTWYVGSNSGNGKHFPGDIMDIRVYSRILSDTEVSNLHSAGTGGNLTSSTKSFSSSFKPDLQNLQYSLNGGSLNIDVIGSPGTASEEIVNSGSLDGTQTSADLTWSDSHIDFRVKPNLSTSAVTNTPPTVSQIELINT